MVKYSKEQKLKLLDDKLTELELNSEKKKELVRRLKNASKGIDLIELLHSFKKYKETLELNDLHFMLSCLETFKNIEILLKRSLRVFTIFFLKLLSLSFP